MYFIFDLRNIRKKSRTVRLLSEYTPRCGLGGCFAEFLKQPRAIQQQKQRRTTIVMWQASKESAIVPITKRNVKTFSAKIRKILRYRHINKDFRAKNHFQFLSLKWLWQYLINIHPNAQSSPIHPLQYRVDNQLANVCRIWLLRRYVASKPVSDMAQKLRLYLVHTWKLCVVFEESYLRMKRLLQWFMSSRYLKIKPKSLHTICICPHCTTRKPFNLTIV